MKRQMKELIRYFETRKVKLSLQNGKVVVSGVNSDLVTSSIRDNKYLKIALLSEALNYEKPIYSAFEKSTSNQEEAREVFHQRNLFKENRPDVLDKEKKETVQANKKKELDLVAN